MEITFLVLFWVVPLYYCYEEKIKPSFPNKKVVKIVKIDLISKPIIDSFNI